MSKTHLFDLIWEDIIVSRVLPSLSIRDCLNLRCVSKNCLQLVQMYFARMKEMKLVDNIISPYTFKVLSSTCTRLQVVNLSKCCCITDSDLIPLLRHNRHIVSLNLSQCRNLSAKCLQPVILHCSLNTLKLSRCTWLTTGALEALALHQCHLEDVDLSYCTTVSDNGIQIFIKKFRRLRTLSLEGNVQVSDRCLHIMSKYSSSLVFLNLSGCGDITDTGVRALATKCDKLQGLMLRGCNKVSESSLTAMRGRVHLDRRPAPLQRFPLYLQV